MGLELGVGLSCLGLVASKLLAWRRSSFYCIWITLLGKMDGLHQTIIETAIG